MGGEGKWARRPHHGVDTGRGRWALAIVSFLSVSAFVDNGGNAESNESKSSSSAGAAAHRAAQ